VGQQMRRTVAIRMDISECVVSDVRPLLEFDVNGFREVGRQVVADVKECARVGV